LAISQGFGRADIWFRQTISPIGETLGHARILLADDHPAVCDLVAALLKQEFEIVGTVANGRDLLDEASRLQPDVVVTDISMPLLDGIVAATQLRASSPAAKVVFLTIHDRPEFVRAALAAGALGYVTKRRLATDLIPAINEALAGRRFISPVLGYHDEHNPKEKSA
jgi:DNA-binding NarL/FixJ family response regulator